MSRNLNAVRRMVPPGLLVGLLVLAACGGGDDTDGDAAGTDGVTTQAPTAAPPEGDTADATDATAPPDDASDEASDAPPAEDSGTITVAGATTDLGPDDFGICETVNPAFAEAFNIVTRLDDGTAFRLNGDLGDMDPELDGLFLGQIPTEEQATDLVLDRDGRTISGSASVAAGEVTFSFTC